MSNIKIIVAGNSHGINIPLTPMHETYFSDITHDKDNIDKYNPYFCELTGLYYGWKNIVKDEDIVGFEQRKRTFRLSENEINDILKDYDVIAYRHNNENPIKAMQSTKKGKELALAAAIVSVNDEKFGKYLYKKLKENHCYEGNMFIAKKETINKYLNFIFNTLAEFDKNHNFKISRIDGYIAEYLFGPWLEYNGLKIKNQKRKNTSTGKIC